MQSIAVYEVNGIFDFENIKIDHRESESTEVLNNVEEKLRSELFVNEQVDEFRKCSIVMDEIFKMRARVFNTPVTELIVTNSYEVYFNEVTGLLIVFANKNSAERICELFTTEFNINYSKKIFDLQTIIAVSTDVRKAQFKNVRIQTINGSQLNGNNVNTTDIYDLMLESGELSTVAVTYPFNNTEVSFSVSTTGSIVLFSTLDGAEVVTLILDLFI